MHERGGEQIWRQVAFFVMTLCVLAVCGVMLYPFLSAIVGGVVLAVVTQRPYNWIARRTKNPNLSAALMVLFVVISVIVPGFFLAQALGRQLMRLFALVSQQSTQWKIVDMLGNYPGLVAQIQNITNEMNMSDTARSVAVFLGGRLTKVLSLSITTITQLVIMVILLFFLYRDRDQAVQLAHSIIPLRDGETSELLIRCKDTIYATVLGRLAIAGIQGTLSGFGFWFLGVPGAALWAVLTVVMALIPAFGAVLVWAPIAVYLGLTGHWGRAALLAIWGGGVVSLIDNILYPILVGSHIKNHTAIILLSILSGVALFGVTGIILGPLAFTIAGRLLEFWKRRVETPQIVVEESSL